MEIRATVFYEGMNKIINNKIVWLYLEELQRSSRGGVGWCTSKDLKNKLSNECGRLEHCET